MISLRALLASLASMTLMFSPLVCSIRTGKLEFGLAKLVASLLEGLETISTLNWEENMTASII